MLDVMLPLTSGGGVATEPAVWKRAAKECEIKKKSSEQHIKTKTLKKRAKRPHLLHGALLLNLALPELLQQHQLGLLQPQLLLQLLDDALTLLGGTLLHARPEQKTTRVNDLASTVFHQTCLFSQRVAPTISLSVSVLVRQWPFISGLEGSLSDSTITSSGDGGCFSFFTALLQEDDTHENNSFKTGGNARLSPPVQFGFTPSRGQDTIVLRSGAPLAPPACAGTHKNKPEINNAVMAAEEEEEEGSSSTLSHQR